MILKKTVLLSGILILLSLTILQCRKTTDTARMVIVFVTGKAQIERGNQVLPVKQGTLVLAGDILKTENGSIDLQEISGNIIRLKEYARLRIDSIASGDSGKTVISLNTGKLIAKVDKLKSKAEFTVVTPVAIAGVRGTAFSISVENGIPRVKVFSGSVALSPGSEKLNNFTEEEFKNNPGYEKLRDYLSDKEVVIEPETEVTVEPEVADLLLMIENRIPADKFETKLSALKPEDDLFSVTDSPVTPQENAEIKTVVQLDEKTIKDAVTGETADLEKEHQTKMENAFGEIEQAAGTRTMTSVKDFQKFYNVVEIVHMDSGEPLSGAIVAQVGDTMIMHSTKGVKRLDRNHVNEVEYLNYDIKVKKKK